MKKLIGWAMLFLGASGQGLAAEDVRAQLRQMASLPRINTVASFRFDSLLDSALSSETQPIEEQIACLEKEMNGNVTDIERCCELGALYAKAHRRFRAWQAYDRAVVLCRERLRRHPENRHWLIPLGEALAGKGEAADAEATPSSWRCRRRCGRASSRTSIN